MRAKYSIGLRPSNWSLPRWTHLGTYSPIKTLRTGAVNV